MDAPKPDERDLTCGWRSFRPKWLQKLNTPECFMFFLTIYSFMQGMIATGLTAAGLTSLEKRFKLSSIQAGMIVAASDVSALLLIVFISYFGGHRHKARWLGIGALVSSLGCLLFALPHVLIGRYVPLDFGLARDGDMCTANTTDTPQSDETMCTEAVGYNAWKYMFVFIGAKLLLGAGTTPLFTLGPAYIDENVHPKSAPMYLGVWFIATFFGPGVGYVAGGSLLNVWVDLIQPPEVKLTPDDPRWIGAWWLGYFFGGLLLLFTSFALLGYPREMPGARERRCKAINEGLLPPVDEHIKGRLKDLFPATKALLSNRTFFCNTLAFTCTTLIATGLGPFISKFLQAQFGKTSSTAGILSGVIIIPGTASGIFLGSYAVKKIGDLRQSCKKAAKYCFIFQFIGTWTVLTFLIPGCKTTNLAGVNEPYYNRTLDNLNQTSLCNINCKCTSKEYTPVCGDNDVSYFSPCHAGCMNTRGSQGYSSCLCVPPGDKGPPHGGAKKGTCDRDCKNLTPFLFGAVFLLLANFLNATPNKTVVLRCVPDNQRTYALGLQWLMLSMFGSMPGPVLFGMFIDKTCILWEETCSGKGSCLEYNNELLSYLLVAAALFFQVLSTLFYFGSWYWCKSDDPLRDTRMRFRDLANSDSSEHTQEGTLSQLTEEEAAHAQAGPDSSDPGPGEGQEKIELEQVSVLSKHVGFPALQIESSI